MGQFSKFVRSDYLRTQATANPSAGIYVSAYKDLANSRFVIVAINTGASDVIQPFTVQNQAIAQLTPYRASTAENIVQLDTATLAAGSFNYTLPGMPVTTFVQ